VLQELFGVNADIRKTCDELAEQGFVAAAPPRIAIAVTAKVVLMGHRQRCAPALIAARGEPPRLSRRIPCGRDRAHEGTGSAEYVRIALCDWLRRRHVARRPIFLSRVGGI